LKRFVVDASAAAKWILPGPDEPLRREALQLSQSFLAGEMDIVAPDFFWVEMGSVLWKAARSNRIDAREFEEALDILYSHEIESVPTKAHVPRALSIAMEFSRSVYDSLYIAVAESLETRVITADQKLVNAVASKLPVVWLGSDFALSS
jgi:predicted nucleic acid-binding protein